MSSDPTIGVIIVTYMSGPVISECLDSLMRSTHRDLRVVVCDNRSPDDTVARIRAWAEAHGRPLAEHDDPETLAEPAPGSVTLLHTGGNLGFAGGVNAGLRALRRHEEIGLFWVLNPDSIVLPDTASAFARCALVQPRFGLMGGRIVYSEPPNRIQSDGGRVSRFTGICRNVNQGQPGDMADRPDAASLDFISGASMVASRAFVDRAGLLVEDYFLYFEEVDWAARRGDLPLIICKDAVVHHHGGTAIGTGSLTRRASAFANYFNYRNRMRFIRRFHPLGLPIAYTASLARIAKLAIVGAWPEAGGAFRGLNGLAPPRSVAERIGPDTAALAFGARS